MAQTSTPPVEEFFATDKIKLAIPNLKELTFKNENELALPVVAQSGTKKIGGLDWRFEVHKSKKKPNGSQKLDMYVFCNEECKDHLWLVKVKFSTCTKIVDQALSERKYHYNYFYGFNSYYWILLETYETLTDNIGPVEVELDVNIARLAEKGMPALDTILELNYPEVDSVARETCTQQLLVSKHSLASMSNYFRNLFFENWMERERTDNVYVIMEDEEEFDMESFRFMIYSAMTMGWAVHESNFMDFALAQSIIKMAMKYDVAPLVDYCEKFLLKSKHHSEMILLEMADKYNLVQLKERSLTNVSIYDFMEDFERSQQMYEELTEDTRKRLNQRMAVLGMEIRAKFNGLCTEVGTLNACQAPAQITTVGGVASVSSGTKHKKVFDSYNELAKVVFGTRGKTIGQ